MSLSPRWGSFGTWVVFENMRRDVWVDADGRARTNPPTFLSIQSTSFSSSVSRWVARAGGPFDLGQLVYLWCVAACASTSGDLSSLCRRHRHLVTSDSDVAPMFRHRLSGIGACVYLWFGLLVSLLSVWDGKLFFGEVCKKKNVNWRNCWKKWDLWRERGGFKSRWAECTATSKRGGGNKRRWRESQNERMSMGSMNRGAGSGGRAEPTIIDIKFSERKGKMKWEKKNGAAEILFPSLGSL